MMQMNPMMRQNPQMADQMAQMMQSPMVQQMMSNPETMRAMMQMNPMMNQNPQMAQMMAPFMGGLAPPAGTAVPPAGAQGQPAPQMDEAAARIRFAQQLTQLMAMGFDDEPRCIAALLRCNGNV